METSAYKDGISKKQLNKIRMTTQNFYTIPTFFGHFVNHKHTNQLHATLVYSQTINDCSAAKYKLTTKLHPHAHQYTLQIQYCLPHSLPCTRQFISEMLITNNCSFS